MKFARKLATSRRAVSDLTHTTPSSFVATDSKKVVFEVSVTGRVDNTDVTVIEEFGDNRRLTTVLRFGDEVGESPQESPLTSPPGLNLRDLLLRNTSTIQNIVLWVLYGIWLILSSIRVNTGHWW